MRTVISTGHSLKLPPGCHPSIEEEILLEAGQPGEVPEEALPFVLSFPGVVPVEAPSPQPLAPEESAPQLHEED